MVGSRLELRRLRHVRLLLWVQGLGLGSLLGLLLRWRLHVLLMVRHGFRRVFPAKPPAKVLSARRAALEHLSTPSQRAPWRPAQAASQVPWCSLGTAHKRAYQLLRQWSQHGSVVCKLCNKFVYATKGLQLALAKARHISKLHPAAPKSAFPRLNAQVIVPAKPACDLPAPRWKCSWCHKGLPKLDNDVFICSMRYRMRHCKEAPKGATQMDNWLRQAKALKLPNLTRFTTQWTKAPALPLVHSPRSYAHGRRRFSNESGCPGSDMCSDPFAGHPW